MTDQAPWSHTCRTREEAAAKLTAALLLGFGCSARKNKDRSGGWLVVVEVPDPKIVS